MCGIIGFNWNDKRLLRRMCSAVSHRGPDDFGEYTDRSVSLGHRRLSIIDLSKKGRQPMAGEDGKTLVVFNGEIWNYKELRRELESKGHKFISSSDTEVIVHGYEEYKERIFPMLDGMFGLAIYDKRTGKIVVARDRIGKKPVYYFHNGKEFIFASEMKALLECDAVKREVNLQCLSDYLSLRFSADGETMMKGVKKVMPGSYVVLSGKKLSSHKYWSLPSLNASEKPSEKKMDDLIKEAVSKRLIGDVPIGVLLSGGLDSSAIVSYMSRLGYKPMTFSVGFGDNTDETKYAEMIARKHNTIHKTIKLDRNILSNLPDIVWHADEPLADPAILPTYVLCREVSKHVKVAFSGEGGDEVFGGYADFNFLYTLARIEKMPYALRKAAAGAARIASSMFGYPLKQKMILMSEILANKKGMASNQKKLFYLPFDAQDKRKLLSEDVAKKVDLSDPIDSYIFRDDTPWNNAIQYYFHEWLPNDLLMKADKASMANGLELRNPFLDVPLVEYSFRIDNKYKRERRLFRDVVGRYLPKEIMRKKKQGFVLPITRWFTDERVLLRLRPHIEDLAERGFFKKEEVLGILNNPGAFRNDHRLWVLLNFEIWAKMYIDGVKKEDIRI